MIDLAQSAQGLKVHHKTRNAIKILLHVRIKSDVSLGVGLPVLRLGRHRGHQRINLTIDQVPVDRDRRAAAVGRKTAAAASARRR